MTPAKDDGETVGLPLGHRLEDDQASIEGIEHGHRDQTAFLLEDGLAPGPVLGRQAPVDVLAHGRVSALGQVLQPGTQMEDGFDPDLRNPCLRQLQDLANLAQCEFLKVVQRQDDLFLLGQRVDGRGQVPCEIRGLRTCVGPRSLRRQLPQDGETLQGDRINLKVLPSL